MTKAHKNLFELSCLSMSITASQRMIAKWKSLRQEQASDSRTRKMRRLLPELVKAHALEHRTDYTQGQMLQQTDPIEFTKTVSSSTSSGTSSESVNGEPDSFFEAIDDRLQIDQRQKLILEDTEWIVDMSALMCIQGELVSAAQKLTLPYRDSATGRILDEKQTLQGMHHAMQDLTKIGVFRPATRQQAVDAGKPIVGTRWIFRHRGNRVEARVVAQELNLGEFGDTFAATPNTLATRFVLWWCARNFNFVCATLNASEAFRHTPMDQDMFCERPAGSSLVLDGEPGEIMRTTKVLYGFQTSSRLFQEFVEEVLKKHKVRRLKSEACLFLHEPTNTLIAVHADEVIFATPSGSVEFMYQLFESEMKLRRGSEISREAWTPYLGKLCRRTEKGFEVRIPERFWQSIFDLFGLRAGLDEQRKAVVTPFATKVEHEAGDKPLSREALRLYRIMARKVIWAGSERPELLYAINELCRHFRDATQVDLATAERITRYMLGTFRKILQLKTDNAFMLPEASRQLAVQAVSGTAWASVSDRQSISGGTIWIEGFLLHMVQNPADDFTIERRSRTFGSRSLCTRRTPCGENY